VTSGTPELAGDSGPSCSAVPDPEDEQGWANEGEDQKDDGGRDIDDDGRGDDLRSGGANVSHAISSKAKYWAGSEGRTKQERVAQNLRFSP
jgi:hypothetical protein